MGLQRNKINLAIISPHHRAQTETFIEAHEMLINANVYFYHGVDFPIYVNGRNITLKSIIKKNWIYLKNRFVQSTLKEEEQDLLKSFKENRIQVVLAEYGFSGVRVMKVCKKLQIPLLVHFHGYDAHNKQIIKIYGDSYKEMFEQAKTVFSVSGFMSKALGDLGCPKSKIILNTYGPSDDFFNIKPDYNSKSFLSIGRFVDKKAPYYLILAFKEIVKKYPDANLHMVGDGPLYETCDNLIRYWGLDKNIILHGLKGKEKIMELMKKSCCYIQHSVVAQNGDAEGTPVSILEAAAAGLPIIATRHAGIVDVLVDQEMELLINEHDVDGLKKAIESMFEIGSIKRGEMGEEGRERIRTHYSMDHHIETLEKYINSAINKAQV